MLFTVWAGKLTEGFVDALGGLADDVPFFAVRGNRPPSTPWYTELWLASSGVGGQLTFYGLSTAAKRPPGARVCPRGAGNRAVKRKSLSGFALPGVPSGDGGAGGRRGEATDTAPRPRKRSQQARQAARAAEAPAPGGGKRRRSRRGGRGKEPPGPKPEGRRKAGRGTKPTEGKQRDPRGRTRSAKPAPEATQGQAQRARAKQGQGQAQRTQRAPRERDSAHQGRARERGTRRTARARQRAQCAGSSPRSGGGRAPPSGRAGQATAQHGGRTRSGEKAPATAKPKPGQARSTTLWSAGNLPARELAGWVGAILPPGPDPQPSHQRSGSRRGHELAWCPPSAAVSARLVRAAISAA